MKRSSIRLAGKAVKRWEFARRELKAEFERMGITRCELGLLGCWGGNALGFAHLKKRRHLGPDELKQVVLACGPCHEKIERMPEAEMGAILMAVIEARR